MIASTFITAFMTVFGILLVLLTGAVYCALVVSKKTDDMISRMHDEPNAVPARRSPSQQHRSIFGSA